MQRFVAITIDLTEKALSTNDHCKKANIGYKYVHRRVAKNAEFRHILFSGDKPENKKRDLVKGITA